jgi:hypothetical protein
VTLAAGRATFGDMTSSSLRSALILVALSALLGGCGGCSRTDGAESGALRPEAETAEVFDDPPSSELARAPEVTRHRTESLDATPSAAPESAPPDVGSIEVRILDADGEPDAQCTGTIYLLEVQPGEANLEDLPWGDEVIGRTAPAQNGAARVDGLPLGKSWAAQLDSTDWLGPPPARSCSGPTQPSVELERT